MSVFSDYILNQLKLKAISRATFAKEIGKNESSVNSWIEKGSVPRDEFLKTITDFFNTDYIELRNLIDKEKELSKNKSRPESYDKMYKLTDIRELLVDKAISNVTRREVAKLMAKVYEKPLETILDELHQSDVLELDEVRKRK